MEKPFSAALCWVKFTVSIESIACDVRIFLHEFLDLKRKIIRMVQLAENVHSGQANKLCDKLAKINDREVNARIDCCTAYKMVSFFGCCCFRYKFHLKYESCPFFRQSEC